MKRIIKPLRVIVFTGCAIGWGVFSFQAIQNINEEEDSEYKPKYTIEHMKSASILNRINDSKRFIFDERDRLVEEEQIRLQELERKRLLKLEEERLAELARIEAEKKRKLDEQKKLELEGKKGIVYNEDKGTWRTFEATYYSAFCKTCGGKGLTASGISVANSIYHEGLRVIATNQSEIPMFSVVEVNAHYGSFKAIALDTGGFGAGGVDILVDSTKTAYSLGRHNVKIRVIGKYNR